MTQDTLYLIQKQDNFSTSAALYVTDTQNMTDSRVVIPCDIVTKEEGGKQPVAVADNWNHNQHTVDGKYTTHSMTSICIAPKGAHNIEKERITCDESLLDLGGLTY